MGLFGLSTSEAILLTRQLNAEQERRNKETLRAINQQTEAAERQAKEGNKVRLEAIGQIGAEARQLEPFITLHLEYEVGKVDRTIAIRPSDIREIEAMDDSYSTTDYDSPAPFGYYSKTIHRPYTLIVLWSTKQIKVTETVEQVQEMVSQNIDRVSKIQAQILADAARMDFDDIDPNHLVHKHIDQPSFEEAQGESC